jgi:hypothetical protein
MRESPRGKAFDLASVRQSAGEIERRVVVLAARAEYVASFLSATSAAEINAALERARARERAAEEDAGAAYRGLIETYEGHLQSLRVLEREKERFVATGEHLVGTLEAFPADLTRVQCLRLAIGDRERTDEALQSAARLCQSLGAAEEALQDDAFLTRAERALESSEPARVRPQT